MHDMFDQRKSDIRADPKLASTFSASYPVGRSDGDCEGEGVGDTQGQNGQVEGQGSGV